MDSGLLKTFGLAIITVVISVFVIQASGSALNQASGTVLADSAMVRDSGVTPRWINDANVVAMIGTMTAKQNDAGEIYLSAWHLDTVRALAVSLVKENAALQRATDSVANQLHLSPVPSALGATVNIEFQRQIDSIIAGRSGNSLDKAYLAQQVASHALMASYLDQLSASVDRPELQAWLDTLGVRMGSQLARVKAVQAKLAVSDSLVADSIARRTDSLAKRAARRDSIARRRAHRDSIPQQ